MGAKLSLIGVGNPSMGDDGIGVLLVEHLRRQVERGEWEAEGVEFVCAGIDTVLAAAVIAESSRSLVIDSALMNAEAGEIRFFSGCDALIASGAATTHSLPLSVILELVRNLGCASRTRVAGIQPAFLGPSEKLSPELESRVPQLIEKIKEEVLLP